MAAFFWWVAGKSADALAGIGWKAASRWLRKMIARQRGVFSRRALLETAYPIREQLQRAQTVDGLWLGGLSIFQLEDEEIRGKVQRIILPSNSAPILKQLEGWTENPYADYGTMLFKHTERARQMGATVRWIDRFPGFTMLLGNRNGDDAWIHLEVLLPFIESGKRPTLRVTKKSDSEIFSVLCETFDRLWKDEAVEVPKQLFPSS